MKGFLFSNLIIRERFDSVIKLQQEGWAQRAENLMKTLAENLEESFRKTSSRMESLAVDQRAEIEPLKELFGTQSKMILDKILEQITSCQETSITKEIELLMKQLNDESSYSSKLLSDLAESNLEKCRLVEENSSLKSSNTSMMSDLQKIQEKANYAEKELQDSKEQLKKREDPTKLLQQHEKKLHLEFEMEKKNISKSANARAKELGTQVDFLKLEKDKAAIEVSSLKASIETLKGLGSENTLLKSQLSEKSDTVGALEARIRELDYEVCLFSTSSFHLLTFL